MIKIFLFFLSLITLPLLALYLFIRINKKSERSKKQLKNEFNERLLGFECDQKIKSTQLEKKIKEVDKKFKHHLFLGGKLNGE